MRLARSLLGSNEIQELMEVTGTVENPPRLFLFEIDWLAKNSHDLGYQCACLLHLEN